MTRHRFEIEVEVDDEAMHAHDGDNKPPPNEVDEWNLSDLIIALNDELVTDVGGVSEVVNYEEITGAE